LLYDFAFSKLNLEETYFDARKKNEKAVNFYIRFGAKIIDEDDLNFYFFYKKEDFLASREKYFQIILEKSC